MSENDYIVFTNFLNDEIKRTEEAENERIRETAQPGVPRENEEGQGGSNEQIAPTKVKLIQQENIPFR